MNGLRHNLMTLATVTLLAGGCASGTGNMQQDAAVPEGQTPISVTNYNWSDMVIYMVRDGARERLGTVTSQTTAEFLVPTHLVVTGSRIHLLADPIGSPRTFLSPALLIASGQKAEWRLENTLALSSVWVR